MLHLVLLLGRQNHQINYLLVRQILHLVPLVHLQAQMDLQRMHHQYLLLELLLRRRSQLLILVLHLGHLMDPLPVLLGHLLFLVLGHLLCHQDLVLVLDQRVQINHLLLHHRLVLVLHLEVVRHLEVVVLPHLLGLRS